MRALVLGANGQDGSYLCESLLGRGFDVVGLGRTPDSRYVADQANYRYVSLDLEDYSGLERLLVDISPTHCFHFAAVHGAVGDGFTYESRWDSMMRVNTLALHAALECARTQNRQMRIFYAGSAKIFPNALCGAVDEKTPARATCLYSIGKIASRDLMKQYRDVHDIQATNLILFNHDSPRRPPHYFLPKIADAIVAAKRDAAFSTRVRTLDFRIDWGHAREFMDIVADLATASDVVDELVMATGVTSYARDVISDAFRRHGLEMERHIVEDQRSHAPGPEFQVDISRMASAARAPAIRVAALIDELVGILETSSNYPAPCHGLRSLNLWMDGSH